MEHSSLPTYNVEVNGSGSCFTLVSIDAFMVPAPLFLPFGIDIVLCGSADKTPASILKLSSLRMRPALLKVCI